MTNKHPHALTINDLMRIGRKVINAADLLDKPLSDHGYMTAGSIAVRVVTAALISKRNKE